MNFNYVKLLPAAAALSVLLMASSAEGKVILPSVFSDNMVFQQKTKAAIWGKADAGKTVTVTPSWNGKAVSAQADASGNFKIFIPTPKFGGPYTVKVSDGEILTLSNVLVGDVWVCSGQSNMEMPLAGWGKIINYEQEIAQANYPKIRLLQGVHVTSNVPLADAKVTNGGWTECNPKYVAEFSAVAYAFAREVQQKTGIPIGLIHTSWGGTIAEAWTSAETLSAMPDFAEKVQQIKAAANGNAGPSYQERLAAWQKDADAKDPGFQGQLPSWAARLTNVSSWQSMKLPVLWNKTVMPNYNGTVWFRKQVTIPADWAGQDLTVHIGGVDDDEITYFNGEKIGATRGVGIPRKYTVRGNKVKAGSSVITVRVFDTGGDGGFNGGGNEGMYVASKSGGKISLEGDWLYKKGISMSDLPPVPESNDGPNRTTVLYNAMIHPYIQFPVKGAIWYQGESNADRAHQYRTLFAAMISDWRKKWNQPEMPFYFVQLANFMKRDAAPGPSAWAELRDAQRQTLSLPNTGMAVSIDIGDADDIHPKNKQDVGKRLAYAALAKTYGVKVPFSGPVYESAKAAGTAMELTFSATEGGLKASDGQELSGFSIAGADQKFHWAKARIQGNKIIVRSDEVAAPVAVRYAWANNPQCNLTNGSGLPASPFKTDNWPDTTQGKK
ncbi:sialate O-acetylesterase [Pedobacter faecalis]|uniref:sialate O-acetylesterase n=1 Tax=Pedobacter faecalis TaxID=3041495 RepID=UPI00254DEA2A|nr:sialate O-acetylesterase [Pedobacter sp. ELA7]